MVGFDDHSLPGPTSEWLEKRYKMRKFIVERTVESLNQEELLKIAGQVINQKYYFSSDYVLILKYESLGGTLNEKN